MVTHQDHFGARALGVGDDAVQVDGAAHAGFVDHHNIVRADGGVGEQAWDGVGVDTGTVAEFACRPSGRAHTDHPPSGPFEHFADGIHGEGLAGPCPPDDHLHAESLGADASHGVDLIGPQRHPTRPQESAPRWWGRRRALGSGWV